MGRAYENAAPETNQLGQLRDLIIAAYAKGQIELGEWLAALVHDPDELRTVLAGANEGRGKK
ncbi:MAG: hypothetical protein JWO38_2301 [Gemmataceae bacterium]|nr:hypothetical protein [Gemmataceae bacterium]